MTPGKKYSKGRGREEKAGKGRRQRVDDFLKNKKKRDELINYPRTFLKKEEWGLLTIMNLLLAGIFPAYFVNILLISFFTEIGHLWTTHLSETERARLVEFEKKFRKGYVFEEKKKWEEAIGVYRPLVEEYKKNAKIAKIAEDRIVWIEKNFIKKGR